MSLAKIGNGRRALRRGLVVGLFAAVAILGAAACVPTRAEQQGSSLGVSGSVAPIGRATVDEGQKIYQGNCASCHGDKGDRVPVAPLNSKDFLDSRGDATLVTSIADGKGVMPAWSRAHGGPLNDDEVRATVAYLNLNVGRSSPALLAGTGRALFEQNCVSCHGATGERIPVAPLSAKAFIDSRTDAELLEAINEGKGIMPGFVNGARAPLADEQSRALVSYLRFGAESAMADRARRGRELYLGNCLACHGERGERIPNVTLASPDFLRKLGDGALITTIAEGKGVMPGFSRSKGGTFEVPEVAAVLTYLKTWSGLPAGSALTGVEQPSEGRDIFAKNCTACHGDSGDHVPGVRLKSREFLDARTDDGLARVINLGNVRGMPAWGEAAGGPLRPDDVKKVTEYLRSVAVTTSGATGAGQPTPPAPVATVAQTSAGAPTAGDPAKGKAAIGQHGCGVCHTIPGIDGANGSVGPNLTGVGGRPKIAGGAVENKGAADIKKWILDPPALKPGTAMPKVGLTEDEATNVAAYLTSAEVSGSGGGGGAGSPGGGPANDTPAAPAAAAPIDPTSPQVGVNATMGRELFTQNCVACHGENGLRQANCPLGSPEWLANLTDEGLRLRISNGKPGAGMPTWSKRKGGPLSDSQIDAIMQYIAALAAQNGAATIAARP